MSGFVVSAFAPSAAFADAESDKAKEIFGEASDAYKAKDYAKCVAKADEAWTHFQHVQIRGLRGACEAGLGKFREGATDLAFYIGNAGANADPILSAAFTDAKQHVAEIHVSTPTSGADVKVDGADAGQSPATVYVEPGAHEISASTPTASGSDKRSYAAGTKQDLPLELRDKNTPPPPVAARPIWPGIVALSVGGVSLVVGGALFGVHASALSDADSKKSLHCDPAKLSADCQTVSDDLSRASTTGNAALPLMVGGGVVLAAGAGLLIWSLTGNSGKHAPAAAFVAPVIGSSTQGVIVGKSF